MKLKYYFIIILAVQTLYAKDVKAQLFNAGNVVVWRVNGTSNDATSVSIVEYDTIHALQAIPVSNIALPSVGTGVLLTNSGSAVSEGQITLDADRMHLIAAGYNAVAGTNNVASTSGINRSIFSILPTQALTNVADVTDANAFSGNNIRSATASGTNYYAAGNGSAGNDGIMLLNGATATQITATSPSTRVVQIFNGQLFYSTDNGTAGIYSVGAGMPTSIVSSSIIPTSSGAVTSPFGFAISPGSNVLYIADDVAGINKYTRTSLSSPYTFAYNVTPIKCRGLAVDFLTTKNTLFATTTITGDDSLIKIVDDGLSFPTTVLAIAGTGTSFRGVALTPAPYVKMTGGGISLCSGAGANIIFRGNPGASVNYHINSGGNQIHLMSNTGVDTFFTGFLTTGVNDSVVTYSLDSIITSAGTYSVAGTVSYTINPSHVAVISGPAAVCPGTSMTLTDTTVGGTWSISNGRATISSTGIVTGVSPGDDTVTYRITNTCGIVSQTKIIHVNALPLVKNVAGGGNVCAGTSGVPITLSGSETTVKYDFYNGSSLAGTVTGTGSPISFGPVNVAGTYTVFATDTTTFCVNNMAGSATVNVNLLPAVQNVSGSGAICVGDAGLPVNLSGSQTMVKYQLFNGSTPFGTAVAGTGSAMTIHSVAVAGTYTVSATDTTTTCRNDMAGSATIIVNPLPRIDTVIGGGTMCFSGTGVSIGLDSSENGVNYQLMMGATPVFTSVTGLGFPINFGTVTTAGTYTVTAWNPTTLCTSSMYGSASVIVNPLPVAETVSPGGHYCAGGTGIIINVSPTQTSVKYQLMYGSLTGLPVAGNGGTIYFPAMTAAGTYSVVGTDTITHCTTDMSGSATIVIDQLPRIDAMTGGGTICAGSTGVLVGLSGSEVGVNYQFHIGSLGLGAPISGTGFPLSLGYITTAGVYTVSAVNVTTSCSSDMAGTAVVIVNPLPPVEIVTGGGNFCTGGTGVPVGLSSSHLGISYQLYHGGTPYSGPQLGTGAPLNFGLITTAGTYTVLATDTTTLCTNVMAGGAVVQDDPLPIPFTVIGGGSYCFGGAGVSIGLIGSESGVNYQLFFGSTSVGAPVPGTGFAISFGLLTPAGTYTVAATGATSTCYKDMLGSASIDILPLPWADTIKGPTGVCVGGSIVLADPASGGIWSSQNTNASVAGGVVTGLVFGTDTINYTVTNTCGTAVASHGINVFESPTAHISIEPGNTICSNSLYQNFGTDSAAPAGTFYTWSATNGVVFATSHDQVRSLVNFYTPGIATVRLTATKSSTGCSIADSFSTIVGLDTYPNSDILYAAPMLICQDNESDSYQWGYDDAITLDSTLLPAERFQNYYNPDLDYSHKYYWVMTSHGGCLRKSYFNRPTGTGTKNIGLSMDDITLYPNPATHKLYIKSDGVLEYDSYEVTVLSITGKQILRMPLKDNTAVIDVSSVPPGAYLLYFTSNGIKIGTKSFIKN